jgi:hypothetical protein
LVPMALESFSFLFFSWYHHNHANSFNLWYHFLFSRELWYCFLELVCLGFSWSLGWAFLDSCTFRFYL